MTQLKKLINQITEFGINPKVKSDNNTRVLKNLLVGIYYEFQNLEFEFDQTDYPDEPDFEYAEIRKMVESNFPDFGNYSLVLDMEKMPPEIEFGIGDAIDDLTDIIKDLLAIKWRMENTSEMDALWHFELLMRSHSEDHLINLLRYIKERD